MATVIAEVEDVGADAAPQPYRMTLEVYERIAALGIIRPEDHVVLLDGILVQTMTKGPGYCFSLLCGQEVLRMACPEGWHVRPEQPIALPNEQGGDSAPEPDLSVAGGTMHQYRDRHPGPSELGLVVEIAASSAMFTPGRTGLRRYAYAGILTVWIVTLFDRKVHIYTEPSGPTTTPSYARVATRQVGELIEANLAQADADQPAILGPIAVASLLPPAP